MRYLSKQTRMLQVRLAALNGDVMEKATLLNLAYRRRLCTCFGATQDSH